MDKTFLSSISVEKFAAFLEGNLPQEDMDAITQLAEHDNPLHQLLNASSIIDNTIACYSEADLQLPPEITGSSFEIPYIANDDVSTFVTLRPEPNEVIFADAVACASDSISNIEDHIANDDIDIPDNNDDFVNLLPGNDSLDGGDSHQSSFPEDI